MNLGPPNPPPASAARCDSSNGCGTDEVCQVTTSRRGSTQGCVAAVDALLGIAYDMAAGNCINGPAGRCLLTNPPATAPVPFAYACNCTYVSPKCCDSPSGEIVHESNTNNKGALTPPSRQCCSVITGHSTTLPRGQTAIGTRCPNGVGVVIRHGQQSGSS